jgi:lysophospholipase L1-like esterase
MNRSRASKTLLDGSPARVPLKRRIVYFAIVYLAFVLLLLGVEVVTRLTLPHLASLELFVNTRQQQAQIASQQQSTIFEGDPLLLWRLKPNLDQVVWDFTVLSTNDQGLRADHPLEPKQPGAIRVVCLGDSVTFGYRVPPVWPARPQEYDAESLPYPMLLEKELRSANPGRGIEVIDMAVPGYTSQQGLAWLRRDIDKLQPDLLVISFGWNDASMSDGPDRETIKSDWTVVGTRWLMDHSQAFAHATRWLRARRQSAPAAQPKPVPRISQSEYVNNILTIVALAREHGAAAVVIAAPYRDNQTNPLEAETMYQYRVALRSVARQNRVPFLEIPELTEAAYPANVGWFGELIHPNEMGHRLLASELLKVLATQQLLKELQVPEIVP